MKPIAGERYIHFKNKKLYEIIGTAILTTDDSVVVVYKGLYNDPQLGNEPLFARPLEEFIGKAPDDEVARFTLAS